MFTSETLQVHILDFDKANSILSSVVNKNAEDDRKFYFGAQHCALIDVNNRYVLVTPDANMYVPQINDIKNPVTLFELDVFEEQPDLLMLKPHCTVNLPLADIESLKTSTEVSLRKFMGANYNASQVIYNSIDNLLRYVNSPANKNKYIFMTVFLG